jgi:hypothetical protein
MAMATGPRTYRDPWIFTPQATPFLDAGRDMDGIRLDLKATNHFCFHSEGIVIICTSTPAQLPQQRWYQMLTGGV